MPGEDQVQEAAALAAPAEPKFEHPKVLLMDISDDVEHSLRNSGYRVETGTFGSPLRVSRDAEHIALPGGVAPPGETEQEIVIVDTAPPEPVTRQLDQPIEGERHFWQSGIEGVIDPRPLAMRGMCLRSFDRILNHGGVFICFLDNREIVNYLYAILRYGTLEDQSNAPTSTWAFLKVLEQVSCRRDHGSEFTLTKLGERLPGLRAALKDAEFHCRIDASPSLGGAWAPLATNRYGDTVASLIGRDDERQGFVLLLPRIRNKTRFLSTLFDEFLPRFVSQFFPHIQQTDWVKEPPYELPEVLALEQETATVEAKAADEVKGLEAKIEVARSERGFIYDLLTATDTELVDAVRQTLELLGLNDVRDVDEETDDKAVLREDLQIWDGSPTLLVEVKGILGLPKEAYSLQVDKYVAPRMKEWERLDVQGLTIINHQLGKVGLEREQNHVFQETVITHAEKREIGLLTTWELFRLARGYLRHGWEPEHVLGLFYGHGVIEPIPRHYEFVGTVNQFFEEPGALTIDLEKPIQVGDTLAYRLPIEFEEEAVASLRLDDEVVETGEAGTEIGVKTKLSKEQARKGTPVYEVVLDK